MYRIRRLHTLINGVFYFTDQEKLTEEEEGYELDLNPPVLEEAVNLLLVSKTVMSCLLVLQNRRDAERNQELSNTELPTVIHVQPKVCQLELVTNLVCVMAAMFFAPPTIGIRCNQ